MPSTEPPANRRLWASVLVAGTQGARPPMQMNAWLPRVAKGSLFVRGGILGVPDVL